MNVLFYFILNCQNIFFQMRAHNFFNNSDRNFYCEENNISQVYTYIPKIQKKKLKDATIVYV
jgi:hypothetical protein